MLRQTQYLTNVKNHNSLIIFDEKVGQIGQIGQSRTNIEKVGQIGQIGQVGPLVIGKM